MSITHPTQITFTPPGTESASRSLADKLSDVLSVKDYGAKCDGATNDYPALAAMLTALGSTAATLIVPGPCRVDTSITIPATLPVRFEGAGAFVGAGTVTFTVGGGVGPAGPAGPAGPQGPAGPAGAGVAPRRTAPDANDLLVYTFDEAASPWANTGSAGAAGNSLVLSGTSLPFAMLGLFANGPDLGNGLDFPSTSNANIDGPTGVEPPGPLTVTLWHLPRAQPIGVSLGLKGFNPGAVSSPYFYSFALDTEEANGFLRLAFKVTGSTTRIVQTGTRGRIIVGAWNYIGATFDPAGTTQLMLNGTIVQTFTGFSATPIDWGTHGAWSVASKPSGNAATSPNGIFDEFRLANVVRPASYFAAVWKQGMML